jgi:hypothetical protein
MDRMFAPHYSEPVGHVVPALNQVTIAGVMLDVTASVAADRPVYLVILPPAGLVPREE